MQVIDINGVEVKENCFVKVLSLDTKDFGHLEKDELSEVLTMVGEILQVYEIDEYGQAWVTKEWWLSENEVKSHSIGLGANEMEKVQNDS